MRVKEKFFVDDAYLNGYARLCGSNATLVYLCLCRHADRHQESFPSVEGMAEKLAISRDSVMRGIKMLVSWGIVTKEKERRKDKTWLNNRYVLLDKSVWKPKPSSTQQLGAKSQNNHSQVANQGVSQVAVSDTKDTHRTKDTHIRIATNVAPAVFSLKEEIEKLYESPRRDLNLIGWYFEKRKPDIRSKEQFASALTRHLRAAKQLSPFTDEQLGRAHRYVETEYPEWTLETITKKLSK